MNTLNDARLQCAFMRLSARRHNYRKVDDMFTSDPELFNCLSIIFRRVSKRRLHTMSMSKLELIAGMSSELDYQMTFPSLRINRCFFSWDVEEWWDKLCDADNHLILLSIMGNLDSPL